MNQVRLPLRMLSLFSVLFLTTGFADAQPRLPIGKVHFENRSGETILLEARAAIDAFGNKVPIWAQWRIRPNQSGDLHVVQPNRGKIYIFAAGFDYSITTEEGKTHWSSKSGKIDSSRRYHVIFDKDDLQQHREALAAPPTDRSITSALGSSGSPNDEAIQKAAAKITIAAISYFVSSGEAEDIGEAFLKGGARLVSEAAAESAIKDLFPKLSERQARIVRTVIFAALDGDTLAGLSATAAKDELLHQLKQQDPQLGQFGFLADLGFQVYRSMPKKSS